MNEDNRRVVLRVASDLFVSEQAIDNAIAKTGVLVSRLPVARQEAKLAAEIGQSALQSVIAALVTLAEARRQLVQCHDELLEICKLNLRWPSGELNFGGFGKHRLESDTLISRGVSLLKVA